MSLNRCLEALSEFSADELKTLQIRLAEEVQRRASRRFIDFLDSWASESSSKTVSYATNQTTQGWLAVVMVFNGVQQESFRSMSDDENRAKELAAQQAVKYSNLVGSPVSDPMVIW